VASRHLQTTSEVLLLFWRVTRASSLRRPIAKDQFSALMAVFPQALFRHLGKVSRQASALLLS
jgi:hypothetical protein